MFSEAEKRVLESFVTSTEDKIYAIKHNIPPEMFGAFGSYFSRNPKDFRLHLLGAIKGEIEGGETGKNKEELFGRILEKENEISSAIKSGLEQSRKFFKIWYGNYGHKSIANMVWIPMVATNVSQLFARELAYEQLSFFVEQSTRFVSWNASKIHLDGDIIKSGHAETFRKNLDETLRDYNDLTSHSIEYYRMRNPFNSWLEKQSKEMQNSEEKAQKSAYNREIRGAGLDVARFLLPQAIQTNIAWILDARSTEFDVSAWKNHPLREMRESAGLIEKHAGQIAPSLLKYTEANNYYGEEFNRLEKRRISPFEKGIDMISFEQNALENLITHVFKRHNLGGTFAQMRNEVEKMSFEEKIGFLKRITNRRGKNDDKLGTDEEFDLIKYVFEIQSDVGAIRDLRRHQKCDRSEPLYTTENGFQKPFMIGEMNPEANRIFERAINSADETHRKIRKDLPFQAQYVVPMAAMHSLTMSAGLDELQYILKTRTTNQGNFSYRQDAFNLAEAAVKTHPWILGYEKYPEGKSFLQIYKEAPLKNILTLDTSETSLHH